MKKRDIFKEISRDDFKLGRNKIKIKELISKLQEIEQKHGNTDVYAYGDTQFDDPVVEIDKDNIYHDEETKETYIHLY